MNTCEEFDNLFEILEKTEDINEFAALINTSCLTSNSELGQVLTAQYSGEDFTIAATYLEGLIRSLLLRNSSTEEFYCAVKKGIFDNCLFQNSFSQKCALLLVLMSIQIPYEHVKAISMSDKEYLQRRNRLSSEVEDIIALANRPFAQRTEKASVLLNIINSASDEEDRAVLFSVAIDALQPPTM